MKLLQLIGGCKNSYVKFSKCQCGPFCHLAGSETELSELDGSDRRSYINAWPLGMTNV